MLEGLLLETGIKNSSYRSSMDNYVDRADAERFASLSIDDQIEELSGDTVDMIGNVSECTIAFLEEYNELARKTARAEHKAFVDRDKFLMQEATQAYSEGVWDAIKEMWEKVKEFFAKIWNKIMTFFKQTVDWIRKIEDDLGSLDDEKLKKVKVKTYSSIIDGKFPESDIADSLKQYENNLSVKDSVNKIKVKELWGNQKTVSLDKIDIVRLASTIVDIEDRVKDAFATIKEGGDKKLEEIEKTYNDNKNKLKDDKTNFGNAKSNFGTLTNNSKAVTSFISSWISKSVAIIRKCWSVGGGKRTSESVSIWDDYSSGYFTGSVLDQF